VRDRHGDRRLADAAGAGNRDEARGDELVGDRGDRILAPDHPLQAVRQLHGRQFQPRCGARSLRDICARDRRHEAITAAGERRDVAGAILAVAERLAKRCDVKAQIGLLDREAGPHQRHQVPFADDLVRARHQRHQRVEGLRAERQRDAVAHHQPFMRRHGEWPERQCSGRGSGRLGHGEILVLSTGPDSQMSAIGQGRPCIANRPRMQAL
jgi:hypothetical protein